MINSEFLYDKPLIFPALI